jgi:alkanesulfonate monooxygenase SsuD/methylene tetrahydromethanopterin reductase-like flavin-dependent oxidoreductase (luciferase family)
MRVGICLPIAERESERQATSYKFIRELAVAAEQGGADSIYVADHILYQPRKEDTPVGLWESTTILAALADATTRVELGPLVICAPFRNPGMIAWLANTLDEISGGRFVLGLGAGWHRPEFDAFGFEFEHRVTYLDDSLGIIVPLLRDKRVDYQGRLLAGRAELRPDGPRKGGPPIMIAGRKPRMMALTARWADRWNSVWYGLPTDKFHHERADLLAACETANRDPATIEISAGLTVVDPATNDHNTADSLPGRFDRLVEGFQAWREEGVAEVMCAMDPPSVAMVEEITRAAESV